MSHNFSGILIHPAPTLEDTAQRLGIVVRGSKRLGFDRLCRSGGPLGSAELQGWRLVLDSGFQLAYALLAEPESDAAIRELSRAGRAVGFVLGGVAGVYGFAVYEKGECIRRFLQSEGEQEVDWGPPLREERGRFSVAGEVDYEQAILQFLDDLAPYIQFKSCLFHELRLPETTVADSLDELSGVYLGPTLKTAGFKKKARCWTLEGRHSRTQFELFSRSFGTEGYFYLEVEHSYPPLGRAKAPIRFRVKPDEARSQESWKLTTATDLTQLGSLVCSRLQAHLLPWLERYSEPREAFEAGLLGISCPITHVEAKWFAIAEVCQWMAELYGSDYLAETLRQHFEDFRISERFNDGGERAEWLQILDQHQLALDPEFRSVLSDPHALDPLESVLRLPMASNAPGRTAAEREEYVSAVSALVPQLSKEEAGRLIQVIHGSLRHLSVSEPSERKTILGLRRLIVQLGSLA